MDDIEQYGEDVQRVLLSFMISDPTSFTRSRNIIRDEYFEDHLRPAVRYILDYANKYSTLPTPAQIKAGSRVQVDPFEGIEPQHAAWYLENIEGFCRFKALEFAILDGMELLEKGQGGEVERRVREALTISLMHDLGLTYFKDPKGRLEDMRDRSNYISTGWKTLDDKLYGGFTRGALNVFAGGSGSGKSLFLQNIALNWVYSGMNVVYFTLELSEALVAMRLDAMVTGVGTKEILRNLDDVSLKVKIRGRDSGVLVVKKLPEAGTTANDLRAFLKQYEIQTGIRPDAIIVDYLDLMHPNSGKINPSDLFVKDKYTSEEMRALAGEMDLLCVTASQLNRQSVDAEEFDHSHIAGGISKINTSDNVFGIFTSLGMREKGIYELQFLKTRSAAAVGQKIKLAYNPQSLRITDMDPDADQTRPRTVTELQKDLKAETAAEHPKTMRGDLVALMNKVHKR